MQEYDIEEFRLLSLPSQSDIISNWEDKESLPTVSIVCIAYNQEKYIEDAIRGLLIQRTTFPFEIIIHDDASTDSTTEIILKYKRKYPDLIRVIIQTENQYSKSPNSILVIPADLARGEYIALCEGDDFWIDPEKLEKQIKALKEKREVKICFSAGLSIFTTGEQIKSYMHAKNLKTFSPEEVIRGGGGFMPTCSLVIHKSVFELLPDWFCDKAPVGDVFLQILASIDKGSLYLPDITCVYRVASEGSWTFSDNRRSDDQIMNNRLKVIECLNSINEQTNKDYNSSFQYLISTAHCSSAFNYLIASNYSQAKKYISLSWGSKKYISIKQCVLKHGFILSPLIRFYFLLRQKYKS